MSELKPAQSAMLDVVNALDEISAQMLFLSVSVAPAWDDKIGDGVAYILTGIYDRITAASARLHEALRAPDA